MGYCQERAGGGVCGLSKNNRSKIAGAPMRVLSNSNTKALKARKAGWYQITLELAPHTLSGYKVCQYSDGCEASCLFRAGRGRFDVVSSARHARTHLLFEDYEQFWARFDGEMYENLEQAGKLGLKVCVRMNTLSDLPFHRMYRPDGVTVFDAWPDLQFFDYTKRPLWDWPTVQAGAVNPIPNYHLTASWGASWTVETMGPYIEQGINVAVVFQDKIPKRWGGAYVISGEKNDLRFLDTPSRVVGLLEKSTPQKQAGRDSGFIQISEVA